MTLPITVFSCKMAILPVVFVLLSSFCAILNISRYAPNPKYVCIYYNEVGLPGIISQLLSP